ncbi:hypothetical protein [Oleiharenicola lentus]|uniref:hypothetical protein n=1 Tax=Oleiharenicola lentus TaxID=2508720 RepID=UPI003F665826
MSVLRSRFKSIIALFGLVAVLLGALEHEDLIFQDVSSEASVFEQDSVIAVAQDLRADRGTEGTFRSENNRLWLSPRQEVTYTLAPVLLAVRAPRKISADRPGHKRLAGLGGILALRL